MLFVLKRNSMLQPASESHRLRKWRSLQGLAPQQVPPIPDICPIFLHGQNCWHIRCPPLSLLWIVCVRQGEEIPMYGPPIFLTQFQKTVVVGGTLLHFLILLPSFFLHFLILLPFLVVACFATFAPFIAFFDTMSLFSCWYSCPCWRIWTVTWKGWLGRRRGRHQASSTSLNTTWIRACRCKCSNFKYQITLNMTWMLSSG